MTGTIRLQMKVRFDPSPGKPGFFNVIINEPEISISFAYLILIVFG